MKNITITIFIVLLFVILALVFTMFQVRETESALVMTFGKATGCQVYGGCASPVVWCNVGGAHQSGNNVIAESAWQFWNTLK